MPLFRAVGSGDDYLYTGYPTHINLDYVTKHIHTQSGDVFIPSPPATFIVVIEKPTGLL